MPTYEEYLANLDEFVKYAALAGDRNEATTRLQLIDRLFFDCLGWRRDEDVILEDAHGGSYVDYVFSAPRDVLIVEAKREGQYFEFAAGTDKVELSIRALLRGNRDLSAALEQAAGYCQTRGVPLAAVGNGHQLVVFVAVRTDAIPPLDGKALVFASPHFMQEHALELWNALSPSGVLAKWAPRILLEEAAPQVPRKLSATIPNYPGIKGRNVFQTDLQVVSEVVLEDAARAPELETTFLRECYCASGALSQYALMSKEILQARYAALVEESTRGPTTVPITNRRGPAEDILEGAISSRPILIIGDVGVGKTSFIRNLIMVEAADVFANAVLLYLDLGTRATLGDLRTFVLDEITRQLREQFGVDIENASFVRDVYRADLARFAKGIHAAYRESQPDLYLQKEVAFLEAKLTDREQHLRHSIHRVASAHHKQIVVFLDNSDQRDDPIQQQAFLIAQEIAAHWRAAVFLTLRPETFYKSTKEGALSGYHPKAFTVDPPRIDRVLAKRLEFALKLARGEITVRMLGGIGVKLKNLESVLLAFRDTLNESHELGEFIDNIAAGNVRLALDLVRDFFGSGHVDTRKIVDTYEGTGRYQVSLHEFLRAVMYGDNVHYDSTRSPIANLFDISTLDAREHFLLPILLTTIQQWSGPGQENGFVETGRVYERLQSLGYTPDQIDVAFVRGHRHKLLETSARRPPGTGVAMPSALRITTTGVYHIERLCKLFAYIDAVAVDMPILDDGIRARVHDARNLRERTERVDIIREYLDGKWPAVAAGPFDWRPASTALRAETARVKSIALSLEAKREEPRDSSFE
jgi:hypothetical protein